jgi:HlyD family secretion protein
MRHAGCGDLAVMAVMPLEEPRPHIELPIPLRRPSVRGSSPPLGPSRRVLIWAALIATALAGVALVGWRVLLQPVAVEVAAVSTDIPVQVFGLGAVAARVQSGVGFKVAGVLVALNADAGDRVPAGAVLARLDAREVAAQLGQADAGVLQARAGLVKARADVEAAEANRANAAAVAKRRSDLAKGGHASVEEMQTTRTAELSAVASLGIARAGIDVAAASLTAAEAQVTFAQAVLDNYTLRAPYDALVVARNLQLGAMPVPGQTVLTLVDPATIWVLGYVDERLAGGLAVGQRAEITLRSEAGRHYPGHVARIEIQSDAVNEERLVEIAFDAIPRDIHLAEQAEVVITTGRIDRAVLVPQTSVAERRASRGTVWTIQDGRLARREVTVGAPLLDGRLPIIDGLADDIRVVISPATGLRAGRAAVIAEKASQ